ncbi:hypothetical protein ACFUJR_32000 [Streptomyces sp. NPDC057271]|uniref:hypothetical protein n=1 Tax=unclassified Streptomyces TaxID=2593676 RepID=UPI00362E57B5
MTPSDPAPVRAWAAWDSLLPKDDRMAAAAAMGDHVHRLIRPLRELELGDTPPAPAYIAVSE